MNTVEADNLKYLLKRVNDRVFTADLSEVELAALARIYIAVHNMVVVNDAEEEYGSREFYRRRINELYTICSRRCINEQVCLEKRILLIYTLYQLLLNPTLCFVDHEKLNQCEKMAYEVVTECLQRQTAHASDNTPLSFNALLLIMELCGSLSEEELEEEEMIRYFRAQLAQWIQVLGQRDQWNNLPDKEALQRLLILCRNSDIFLDATYDEKICRLKEYYRIRLSVVANRENENTGYYQTLSLLYEIIKHDGFLSSDSLSVQKIIGSMQQGIEAFPTDSAEQLFCLSWVIEGMCRQNLQEANQKMVNTIYC